MTTLIYVSLVLMLLVCFGGLGVSTTAKKEFMPLGSFGILLLYVMSIVLGAVALSDLLMRLLS